MENTPVFKDFLCEFQTEELPAGELTNLESRFKIWWEERLATLSLPYRKLSIYATPRRLAVLIEALATAQPAQTRTFKGPMFKNAFDEKGNPTIAAQRFAESHGVTIAELTEEETSKGKALVYRSTESGKLTAELLPSLLKEGLKFLPTKRTMYWYDQLGPFVRPLHNLVVLFGNEVLPVEIFNVTSGRTTSGHRFLAPFPIEIDEPKHYLAKLRTVQVIADPTERRALILAQIRERVTIGKIVFDEETLTENVNLVEYPQILVGNFDPRFLKIPREVLITTLKHHQHCFAVSDDEGNLLPHFVVVSNLDHSKHAVAGFAKVITARFSDAEYFYELDCKTPLASALAKLSAVDFADGLGSLYDKTQRLMALSRLWCERFHLNITVATVRAAELSKCDLVSSMVGEFPELQGIMGKYYAEDEGEIVATAIAEHYLPRTAGDSVATSLSGQLLAIADRLDTLVGMFSLGKAPTGNKDPLGLRRAAIGLIRTVLALPFKVDLAKLVNDAAAIFNTSATTVAAVLNFIYERFTTLYGDYPAAILRAILVKRPTDLTEIIPRVTALQQFLAEPNAPTFIAMYKRLDNLLTKTAKITPLAMEELRTHLSLAVEKELFGALSKVNDELPNLVNKRQYSTCFEKLLSLNEPIDHFFSEVMVMTDDVETREVRLCLLNQVRAVCDTFIYFPALISG